MPKPFDASLNTLIDAHLGDWAAYLTARAGLPAGPAVALDTDLSATLQADRLFRVDAPTPFALHLELESSGRLGIPEELLRYHVAARKATGLPVSTVVLMLRPKATGSDLTGRLDLADGAGAAAVTFRYAVVRLWQEPFDRVLNAGLGLTPLALLTNEAAADVPAAVTRFHARLRAEAVPATVEKELLGFASVLGALRYDKGYFKELIMGGRGVLRESPLYQEIHDEGKAVGLAEGQVAAGRRTLLRVGERRFGPPPPAAAAAVQAVADPARLDRLTDRLLDARDWDDLLATP